MIAYDSFDIELNRKLRFAIMFMIFLSLYFEFDNDWVAKSAKKKYSIVDNSCSRL